VFTSPVDGTHDLYVVASQGGLPERLTATPADERFPSFSRDGRWIYFTQRTDGTDQVWKISRSGGAAVQVTRQGGIDAHESPDGRFLYFAKGSYTEGRLGIWRMALPDGSEEKVLDHGESARWDVYDRGVCYLRVGPDQSAAVECTDLATGSVQKRAAFDKQPLAAGFSVSPDGRWILLTRVDRNESDLMMVENFK
jgi:Tol biopolymer transport system component